MIRKKIFNILLFLSLGLSVGSSLFGKVNTQTPYQPNEEELEQMLGGDRAEKMEMMMHEMQHFYESLPEDQQKQFEAELTAEVQKEQEKLASMGPDEQKKYIESAFAQFDDLNMDDLFGPVDEESGPEEFMDYPPMEQKPKPAKDKVKKEEDIVSKKKLIKERLDKIDTIVRLITSIEETLSSITKGAQTVVDSWKQKRFVQTTWDQFSSSLAELKNKLEKIKATDPKTDTYYYLDDTKKADKLFGNLDTLLKVLEKYEPNIETAEISELKEVKLKNELAKSALKSFINFHTESSQTTLSLLDELIKAFEPQAKKIAAEEERLRKMGERPVRQRPGRTIVTGRPDRPTYGTYDRGYGYGNDYGLPGDSGRYYPTSSYTDYTPAYKTPDSGTPSDTPSKGDSTAKPTGKTDTKDKADDTVKTKTPDYAAPKKDDTHKKAKKEKYLDLYESIKDLKKSVKESVKNLQASGFSHLDGLLHKEEEAKAIAADQAAAAKAQAGKAADAGEDVPDAPGTESKLERLKNARSKVKDGIATFTQSIMSIGSDLENINKEIGKVTEPQLRKSFRDRDVDVSSLRKALTVQWRRTNARGKIEKIPVKITDIIQEVGAMEANISPALKKEFLDEPKAGEDYNLHSLKNELDRLEKTFKETEAINIK